MKTRILLLLLALPLLLAGCKKESPTTPPKQPDIPEGTIPVVFHILYENAASTVQNPPAAIIRQRIEQMNKFYASTLFTNDTIPGVPSQDIGLTFTLATHDPNGNVLTEPGIDRVQYAGSTSMSGSTFLMSNNSLPKNEAIFWDPNRYVNIWLFGFDLVNEARVAGMAILAYCTSSHPLFGLRSGGEAYFKDIPSNMHGIALNNRYFLPPSNINPSIQKDLLNDEGMFTLCHEMGHYLGLHHAFSETPPDANGNFTGHLNPDNASDDGCADTPKYDRPKYDTLLRYNMLPYSGYLRQPCDGGDLFVSTNIMDYYYSFRTQFTPEQKRRIEHVMQYSPLIPRGTAQTKALLENFTGEITDERPEPILMY